MHSIKVAMSAAVVLSSLAVVGCSSERAASPSIRIQDLGSRAHIYTSLDELSSDASAIVIGRPTGKTAYKPFPGGGAPTEYVRVRVLRTLSGSVKHKIINVVTPGVDINTGKSALFSAEKYLLYLTPAMYAKNDPAGGYAIVGGPAGTYSVSHGSMYVKIDDLSAQLPQSIVVGKTSIPRVKHTARQLLRIGPK